MLPLFDAVSFKRALCRCRGETVCDHAFGSRLYNGAIDVQAMGENVVGAAPEFARQLGKREASVPAEWDADDTTHVFFDIYGLYMVCCS